MSENKNKITQFAAAAAVGADSAVQCQGLDCSLCSLLKTVSNIFYLLLSVSAVCAVLLLIIAGILYVLSTGRRNWLAKSKRAFFFALSGFALTMVSFLIIQAVYLISGSDARLSWNKIDCNEEAKTQTIDRKATLESPEDNIKTKITLASSVSSAFNDLGNIVKLDVKNLDPLNLASDLLDLTPGQQLRFINVSGYATNEDLSNYINAEQGFAVGQESSSANIEEIATFDANDGGVTVQTAPKFGGSNLDFTEVEKRNELENFSKNFVDKLDKLPEGSVYVFTSGDSPATEDQMTSCSDSNGEWTDFTNRCAAQKQICGHENNRCSDLSRPAEGCQCPEGSCLINDRCEVSSIDSGDEDNDGVSNSRDRCPGTPADETANLSESDQNYGCSCSQVTLNASQCPPTRCEGNNMVTYPNSGTDSCVNGKVTRYSCSPTSSQFSAQCQQVYPIANLDNRGQILSQSPQNSQLQSWMNSLRDNFGRGSGSGSTGGSGSGSGSGSGAGRNTGSNTGNNTGTNTGSNPGSTDSGPARQSTTSGQKDDQSGTQVASLPPSTTPGEQTSTTTSSEEFKPTAEFNELAECAGFEGGKIPENGVIMGFLKDQRGSTMDIVYLGPDGKIHGNNNDTSGSETQSLRGYPNPDKSGYYSKPSIMVVNAAPHFGPSDSNYGSKKYSKTSTGEPAALRGDKQYKLDGTYWRDAQFYKIHGGTQSRGCMGLGNQKEFGNWMDTVYKGAEKTKDNLYTQKPGKGSENYWKVREKNTVMMVILPYTGKNHTGTCEQYAGKVNTKGVISDLQNRAKTDKKFSGYDRYDPNMLTSSQGSAVSYLKDFFLKILASI